MNASAVCGAWPHTAFSCALPNWQGCAPYNSSDCYGIMIALLTLALFILPSTRMTAYYMLLVSPAKTTIKGKAV